MSNKVSYTRKFIFKKDSDNKTILESGKPVIEKIIVTATKRVILGNVISATATCVDVDKFDFEKGKALAKARLDQKLSERRMKGDREDVDYYLYTLKNVLSGLNKSVKKLEKHEEDMRKAKEAEQIILESFND